MIFHANQTPKCLDLHLNQGCGWRHETSLSPPVKIFSLTVPRRCFFCGSFLLYMSCVCRIVLSDHCCLVATCWHLGSRLRCFIVFLSLSHVVSWVKCGTPLYQFLIFATFSYFVTSYCGLGSLKPPCKLTILVLHQ